MSMIISPSTELAVQNSEFHIEIALSQVVPPLHPEQLAALGISLRQHGCMDPLRIWKEMMLLLDGHHRWRFCREHGIPFAVEYISLPDRQAAIDWIWQHHGGRRNWMSAFAQIENAIRLFKPHFQELAKAQKGRRSDLRETSDAGVQPIRWAEEVGKRCIPTVSEWSVRAVAKCLTDANKLRELGSDEAAENILSELRSGELRINRGPWVIEAATRKHRGDAVHDDIPEYINEMGAGFVNNILKVEASPVEILRKLPDDEVTAIISSPPYNAGKDYGSGAAADDVPYDEYLALLSAMAKESYRIQRPGGRVIWNVDSITSRSTPERAQHYKRPIYADVVRLMEDAGFLFYQDIIWDKGDMGVGKNNWGSHMSASHPVVRPQSEYILVFAKPGADKADPYRLVPAWDGQQDDVTENEWEVCSSSPWKIPAERRYRGGHPCPYPEELVTRLIKLYTRPGDWIVDPFVGSGTTTAVCQRLGRRWTGIDREDRWCQYAKQRTMAEIAPQSKAA